MKQVADPAVSTLLNTTIVGQPWHDDYRPGLGVDASPARSGPRPRHGLRGPGVADPEPDVHLPLVQSESDMSSMISASAQARNTNMEGVMVSAGTSYLENPVGLRAVGHPRRRGRRQPEPVQPRAAGRLPPGRRSPGPDFRDK